MGERRFLLVDSSALPDVFLKVLQMTVEEMLTRLARQSFVVEVHRGT